MNNKEKENLKIWFKEPAINFLIGTPDNPPKVNSSGHLGMYSDWLSAFPVGNGRIGGQIFGGIKEELIKLNEESLWSGEPRETNDPSWQKYLPQVQKLILKGNYEEADTVIKNMQGPFNESYMPMASLRLLMSHGKLAEDYCRELLLSESLVKVNYRVGNCVYNREFFASKSDNLIVIRITGSQPASVSFDLSLESLINYEVLPLSDNTLQLKGKAPSHVEPNYMGEKPDAIIYDGIHGMDFTVHARVIPTGGILSSSSQGLHLTAADSAVILLSSATNYDGFDRIPSKSGKNPAILSEALLVQAAGYPYERTSYKRLSATI